jgi:hypothetical protein
MNSLADRKRLLIRQAQIYRELVTLERENLSASIDNTRAQFRSTRWWLIGGMACAGWLLSTKLSGIAKWVPTALAAARYAQQLRG